jgi:sulfite exporter TauE/SafE
VQAVEIGSMFVLGFLGSGHCVGMCGPLVLAIPSPEGRVVPHLAYHAGRVTTYTVVGAVLGALGSSLGQLPDGAAQQTLAPLRPVQLAMTLLAAAFMCCFGLMRLGVVPEPRWMSSSTPAKIPGFRQALKSAAGGRGLLSVAVLGLMMGLLPCGLSYAAFARALPSGSALQGALYVLAFGVGTAPALLLVGTVASGLARRYRRISDVASAVLLIAMAGWLAYKALR